MLTVRLYLEAADEQCRKDVLGFVIRPNADATATGRNVGMIVRWNFVLTAIGRIYNKWLKRLGGQPVANVLRHVPNLPKSVL